MQKVFIILFITTFPLNLLAISPILNPSSILDSPIKVIKEAINFYKKNKQDNEKQENYNENFRNKNQNKNVESLNSQKKKLLERFEGKWKGSLNIDTDILKSNCEIDIQIKNSKFDENIECNNKKLKLFIQINLNQNFSNSYIIIENKKFFLNGDISMFANTDINNKEIKIIGNLYKY